MPGMATERANGGGSGLPWQELPGARGTARANHSTSRAPSGPPRFPPIERDLAVIVSEDRAVADVAQVIRSSGGNLLRELRLFDIYRGTPLGAGEKSVAHRLVFQAEERTLTEAEIDTLVVRIGEALARNVYGRLRS